MFDLTGQDYTDVMLVLDIHHANNELLSAYAIRKITYSHFAPERAEYVFDLVKTHFTVRGIYI